MTPEKANELNEERALERGNSFAFPHQDDRGFMHNGMTKREYMATQLMSGLIANGCTPEDAPVLAIIGADSLLIELNKRR